MTNRDFRGVWPNFFKRRQCSSARIKDNYQLIRGFFLARGESRFPSRVWDFFSPGRVDGGRQYSPIVSRNLAVDELGSVFKGALESTRSLAEESSASFSFREGGVLTYYETICKSYESGWEGKPERGEEGRSATEAGRKREKKQREGDRWGEGEGERGRRLRK